MSVSRRDFARMLGVGIVVTSLPETSAQIIDEKSMKANEVAPESELPLESPASFHSDIRYLPLIYDF
jgi:hypothetical protein